MHPSTTPPVGTPTLALAFVLLIAANALLLDDTHARASSTTIEGSPNTAMCQDSSFQNDNDSVKHIDTAHAPLSWKERTTSLSARYNDRNEDEYRDTEPEEESTQASETFGTSSHTGDERAENTIHTPVAFTTIALAGLIGFFVALRIIDKRASLLRTRRK